VLDELKSGIESLFNKVGCDKSEISVILGNANISDANVMQFLGMIEQRTNELLQTQTLLDVHATQRWERLETELRDKADAGDNVDVAATLVSLLTEHLLIRRACIFRINSRELIYAPTVIVAESSCLLLVCSP
jgi:coiled-coil domain-containing protein 63/114